MQRSNRWIIALGCILVLVTPALYLAESRAVSRCREAGGSYDFARGVCDPERSHPVLPWARRNRGWLMLSGLGLGMALIGVATSRMRTRAGG